MFVVRLNIDSKYKTAAFNYSFYQIPKKKEDSGIWKPDPKKGECGEDLKTQFIVCDDEEGCLATRNEFPYMVCCSQGNG